MSDLVSSEKTKIVLASSSPRRRELFSALGIDHDVDSPDIDEDAVTADTPRGLAIKLAYAKAAAVAERHAPGTLIVAADTVVALGDRLFGKPTDKAHAVRMLTQLSGRKHSVISAVAVAEAQKSTFVDAAESFVQFEPLSKARIEEYVATGEPMDKAGGYAIQGLGGKLVASIEGDYFNVVGLPIFLLLDLLAPSVDVSTLRKRYEALKAERVG